MGFNAGPPIVTTASYSSSDDDGAIEVVFVHNKKLQRLDTQWQADGGFEQDVEGSLDERPKPNPQTYKVTFTCDDANPPNPIWAKVKPRQKTIVAIYYVKKP